jgi:hypothetical protein
MSHLQKEKMAHLVVLVIYERPQLRSCLFSSRRELHEVLVRCSLHVTTLSLSGGAKKKHGGRSLDAPQSLGTLPHGGGGSGGSIGGGTMSYHHGSSNASNGKTGLPPPPHYPMVSDYASSNDRYIFSSFGLPVHGEDVNL